MIGFIRSLFLSGLALSAAHSLNLLCQIRALDDVGKDKEKEQEQQLKNMKRLAAQHTLSPADDRKHLFKFHDVAVMRLSNPMFGSKDGALFIWTDHGRPQAIIKLYTKDGEHFSHEWQSLSESALVAESNGKTLWNPTEPGLTFRELPDAPKPGETPAERLRQMKLLAGKFSATYTPIPKDAKPTDMRLLIQPLFRYDAGDDMRFRDGALFAFANGTDPQGLLILEARKTGEAYKYYYAFARLASGAVIAKLGEKEVYSAEKYDFSKDPNMTFLWLPNQLVPKE
jgi:hypothetical protein